MKLKVLLLNLPNHEQITRRYMCSYTSPESLMPPLELISCGAIARSWLGAEVKLIDAIAEELSMVNAIKQIAEFAPDVILGLTGFECFEEDMDAVKELKQHIPQSKFVLFGHYATQFPEETLRNSSADFVILGEPELVFNELITVLFKNESVEKIEGIAYLQDGNLLKQGNAGRIRDPNELPMPAYDLLPKGKYGEPLLAKPYGMIQTVRGCPYQCSYCVKSYGTKLTQLSTERIIEEIQQWVSIHGAKSIRFIDDTFTINKKRVIELCSEIVRNKIDIEWACLSRTDNLDKEVLQWMKKAGCKRIYFGMESGSQRMLDLYGKNISIEQALETLLLCRKTGIETAAFFMSGHPEELEQDFRETLMFAKAAKLNYASFNPLTPYPGTKLFLDMEESLHFSIYPYRNEWKDKSIYEDFNRRKSLFYKGFYFRSGYFFSNTKTFFHNLGQSTSLGLGMLRYLWGDKQFVISGIKGMFDK